jgi:hypothetical protein
VPVERLVAGLADDRCGGALEHSLQCPVEVLVEATGLLNRSLEPLACAGADPVRGTSPWISPLPTVNARAG